MPFVTRVIAFSILLLISSHGIAKPTNILLDLGNTTISDKTSRQLSRRLEREGYNAVTFEQLPAAAKEELLKFLDGDLTADSIPLLRQHIDFIIYGEAYIQSGKAVLASRVNPQSAILDLKIVSLATGQIIYQAKESATTSFSNETIAAEKATIIVISKTYKTLNLAINLTNEIKHDYYYELTLHNTKDYALLEDVFAKIQALPQIISAELKIKRVRTAKIHSKLNLENFLAQINKLHGDTFEAETDTIKGYKIALHIKKKEAVITP